MGPFLSGGLFTLSAKLKARGELLAWGLFGAVTIIGYFMSWAIDGKGLESDDGAGEEANEGNGSSGEVRRAEV